MLVVFVVPDAYDFLFFVGSEEFRDSLFSALDMEYWHFQKLKNKYVPAHPRAWDNNGQVIAINQCAHEALLLLEVSLQVDDFSSQF